MEKDWTGSAMPSILKGFALIGQPYTKEQFREAFGYDMPEVSLTDAEKKRYGLESNISNDPTPQQTVKKNETYGTEKTRVQNFGQHVMDLMTQGQKPIYKTKLNPVPLNADNSRVEGNTVKEEKNPEPERKQTLFKADDPYASQALSLLTEKNGTQNRGTPPVNTETESRGNSGLNYVDQFNQNENADNLAAQPDPYGQYPNALDRIVHGVNRRTKKLIRKGAGLNRRQQENEQQNHLQNWAADVARTSLKKPVTHSRQDYQPGYQAILGHDANKKLAENMAEPIETTVNGKEIHQIVGDAFKQEFVTDIGKQIMALGSLINHGIATLNGGEPINPELTKQIDDNMLELIKSSDRYVAQSIAIEKLGNYIAAGDDEKTVENLRQFGYELLGEKGPCLAAGLAGGSLLRGAGITGVAATGYRMIKDFTVNLAEANANIIKETGKHNWALALKIAVQTTLGGRVIDNQMEKAARGGGLAGKTMFQIFGDSLKKRFGSMVNDWNIKKGQEENSQSRKVD